MKKPRTSPAIQEVWDSFTYLDKAYPLDHDNLVHEQDVVVTLISSCDPSSSEAPTLQIAVNVYARTLVQKRFAFAAALVRDVLPRPVRFLTCKALLRKPLSAGDTSGINVKARDVDSECFHLVKGADAQARQPNYYKSRDEM